MDAVQLELRLGSGDADTDIDGDTVMLPDTGDGVMLRDCVGVGAMDANGPLVASIDGRRRSRA